MKSTIARGLVPKSLAVPSDSNKPRETFHESSKPRRKKHRVHTTFKQNLDSIEKLLSKNEHLSKIINKHFDYEKQPDYFQPVEPSLDRNYDSSSLKKARELLDRIKQTNAEELEANKALRESPLDREGLYTLPDSRKLPMNKWIIIETPRSQLQKLRSSASLGWSDVCRKEGSSDTVNGQFSLLQPIKNKQSIPPINTSTQASQDSMLSSFRKKDVTARAHDCSTNYMSRIGMGPKRGALEAYLDYSDQNAKTMEDEVVPFVPLPIPKLIFQDGVFLSPRNRKDQKLLPLSEAGRSSRQSENTRQDSRNLVPISRTQRDTPIIDLKKRKQLLYEPVRCLGFLFLIK